jgi:hypothetical protein
MNARAALSSRASPSLLVVNSNIQHLSNGKEEEEEEEEEGLFCN